MAHTCLHHEGPDAAAFDDAIGRRIYANESIDRSGFANDATSTRAEDFSPPYLFKGARHRQGTVRRPNDRGRGLLGRLDSNLPLDPLNERLRFGTNRLPLCGADRHDDHAVGSHPVHEHR